MWRRSSLPEPHPFLRSLQGGPSAGESTQDEDESPWATGAQVPIGLPVNPDEGLPCRQLGEGAKAAFLWVVAAHGGAGASTVTALLNERIPQARVKIYRRIRESPQEWPCGPGPNIAGTVVLVARTHARGLAAATSAARQWASGSLDGINLVGLVLVHDGPRLSRQQRSEIQRVSALIPRSWQIGWHEAWRDLVCPTLSDASGEVRRTASSILAEAHAVGSGIVTSKGTPQ